MSFLTSARERLDRPSRHPAGAIAARCASASVLVAALLLPLGGCSPGLFKRGVPRNQYQTYDTMRNRHAADYNEDMFRNQRINLRGRLLVEE